MEISSSASSSRVGSAYTRLFTLLKSPTAVPLVAIDTVNIATQTNRGAPNSTQRLLGTDLEGAVLLDLKLDTYSGERVALSFAKTL